MKTIILTALISTAAQAEPLNITDRQALIWSGVSGGRLENDHACGPLHENGDIANRVCHAKFAALIREMTGSHILPVLALAAWEGTNKNVTFSDINTAPIQLTDYAEFVVDAELGFILTVSREF